MKNHKSFIAGMITMLLIVSMVGTASATQGKITKELEYRNISVSLDGKKLDLKDAAGNTVEPFMFGGTNYLPVRALAEALGLNVAWDGTTNTVVLTSPKVEPTTPVEEVTEQAERLLFSRDHVRLYFLEISSTSQGDYTVKFRLENDSDYSINVWARDITVTGKTPAATMSCSAEPGKTAVGTLTITKDALAEVGLDKLKTMKTRFSVGGVDYAGNRLSFETGNFMLP